MFLNVIKLDAKVTDSSNKVNGKVSGKKQLAQLTFEFRMQDQTRKNWKRRQQWWESSRLKLYTVVDKKDKCRQEEVDLKCDMCQYTCKKINALNIHMNTKHMDHTSKICYKVFTNSIDAFNTNSAHRNWTYLELYGGYFKDRCTYSRKFLVWCYMWLVYPKGLHCTIIWDSQLKECLVTLICNDSILC